MPRQHCTHFPGIAQEESQANIEQKDKIVRNSDMADFYCEENVQNVHWNWILAFFLQRKCVIFYDLWWRKCSLKLDYAI